MDGETSDCCPHATTLALTAPAHPSLMNAHTWAGTAFPYKLCALAQAENPHSSSQHPHTRARNKPPAERSRRCLCTLSSIWHPQPWTRQRWQARRPALQFKLGLLICTTLLSKVSMPIFWKAVVLHSCKTITVLEANKNYGPFEKGQTSTLASNIE